MSYRIHSVNTPQTQVTYSNVFYLVQAKDFDTAKKYVESGMKDSMTDYIISSIKESAVMDVFEK